MDQPSPQPPLREGALVTPDQDTLTADVVIIGSGMGGGTLAWALKDSGLDVLIVERGQFLPREPENSQPDHVFIKKRYVTSRPWYDAKTGQPFQPGVYYWVGGNTKMYGACLPRFRRSDFEEVTHHDGVSPAWPFSYDDLEPFYAKAEELFEVHGALGEDPTEPEHSTPYPYPPLSHEPAVERLRCPASAAGPAPVPHGQRHAPAVDGRTTSRYHRRWISLRRPATRATQRIEPSGPPWSHRRCGCCWARTYAGCTPAPTVTPSPLRRREVGERTVRIEAKTFVVSGGAVNSTALLLRSVSDQHRSGLGNSSGLLGRNYMVHNSTFFMAVNPARRNDTAWQKTLGLNDWYEAGPETPYPLGNLQMLGKLRAPMVKAARSWAPTWALKMVTDRSLDIYLTTEDLPRAGQPGHRRWRQDHDQLDPEQPHPAPGAGQNGSVAPSARPATRSCSPNAWASRPTPTCAAPQSPALIRPPVSWTLTAAATMSATSSSSTAASSRPRPPSTRP